MTGVVISVGQRRLMWVVPALILAAMVALGECICGASARESVPAETVVRFIVPKKARGERYGNQGPVQEEALTGYWNIYDSGEVFPEGESDFGWRLESGFAREIKYAFPDPFCLHVHAGGYAAFVCSKDIESSCTSIELDAARSVRVRLVGDYPQSLTHARVGLLVHGKRHIHPYMETLAVSESETDIVGIPEGVITSGDAEVFAFSDDCPAIRVRLASRVPESPVVVGLKAGRMLRAVVPGLPQGGCVTAVRIPSELRRTVWVDKGGELKVGLESATRRLVLMLRDVSYSIDVPVGGEEVDAGVLVQRPVRTIVGKVFDEKHNAVVGADVVCVDADGVCVSRCMSRSGGRFTLNGVREDGCVLRVHATVSTDAMMDRCATVPIARSEDTADVLLGPAVALELRDESGAPISVRAATIVWHHGSNTAYHHFYSGDERGRARLELDSLPDWIDCDITVRVRGFAPSRTRFIKSATRASTMATVVLQRW